VVLLLWFSATCSRAQDKAPGRIFYVDGSNTKAADSNPGTADAPWKTIAHAGIAAELQPGDTVLIKSGVYRDSVDIKVSGEPGRPITFRAAPGGRVVLKGSEIVRGKWTNLGADQKGLKEPFPHAFRRVWKMRLGEEFFTDARWPTAYADKTKRWISQVFIGDDHPLQMIGPDGVYKNDQLDRMVYVGHGLEDMIPLSFFFDPTEQTLYLNISGDPAWNPIEVGVRGYVLIVSRAHDVVVHGLELRHNRQVGSQWPLMSVDNGQRVIIEDCKVAFADCIGLGLYGAKECIVRRCDLSNNGCTGLALGYTEDCAVEDCSLMFNNYRHFFGDWGVAAGMKNIPSNKRPTIRRCEAAYNIEAPGIWFDNANEDVRILDNVCHDNGDCGIFFEVNRGGGVIAGNLIYGNRSRGIYVSGSQNTWVVHNTVAENSSGIVGMSRAPSEPPTNTRVLDNLLIHNFTASDIPTFGSDLILEIPEGVALRAAMNCSSDLNAFANNAWQPVFRPGWNSQVTFGQWQQRYRQDANSVVLPVEYQRFGTSFRLVPNRALNIAVPVPGAVSRVWKPQNSARVGADITQWPKP
jgi:parallel beta-helix repeat protein